MCRFLKLGFSLSLIFVVSKPPAPLCPRSPGDLAEAGPGHHQCQGNANPAQRASPAAYVPGAGGQSQSSSGAGRQTHLAAGPGTVCRPSLLTPQEETPLAIVFPLKCSLVLLTSL